MMADPKRTDILLIEDNPGDVLLIRKMLEGSEFHLQPAGRLSQGLELLDEPEIELVLLDLSLPDSRGLATFNKVRDHTQGTPIVVLSGTKDETLAMEAVHAGAQDYLIKGQIGGPLLIRSLRYAIERGRLERERTRLLMQEQAARAEAQRLNAELEQRVQTRTAELQASKTKLENEIAERKRAEAELSELRHRLVVGQETQRLHLAQELHDGPMQELYSVTFTLHMLNEGRDDEEAVSQLEALRIRVEQVIETLRALCFELRPPTLASVGLEQAILDHVEEFRASQPELEVDLDLTANGQTLPESIRLALFRIYQQALTNVARHAQAQHVLVRFTVGEEQAMLEVHDDGQGFEVPPRWLELTRRGHLGLAGAAERAEALGGTLEVRSQPGAGTVVRVAVPRSGTLTNNSTMPASV